MASVDEVAASLDGNKSEAEGLAGQLAATKQQAEELQGEFAAFGAEGTANRAGAAAQTIEGLMSEAAGLAERIGEAQAQVLALGQSGLLATGTGGDSRPSASPPVRAAPSGGPPLPDFAPRRIHPDARETIKRIGWPRNAQGDVAARGLLYDKTGRPLLGGQALPASRTGPGSDTSDLKEPWRSDDRYTTRYHVEGHTAAYMRRNGVTEAALYLNIPPCGNRAEPDPVRCEANLAAHLPEGSVLYVHSVHQNGTTRSKAYQGTGEALA